MSIHAAIGVAALVCFSICGVMGTLVGIDMTDLVNRQLPESEQLGDSRSQLWQLRREYRRLYPEGLLRRKQTRLAAIMIVCLMLVAWSPGFFRWLGL